MVIMEPTVLTRLSAVVQIAVQVAVVFAKVARNDYPRQWQSVFVDLTALMQTGSTLTVRRIYLVLHHILKELSSKRLASDQKNFADVRLYSACPQPYIENLFRVCQLSDVNLSCMLAGEGTALHSLLEPMAGRHNNSAAAASRSTKHHRTECTRGAHI